MTTVILALPPSALERIRVVDLQAFLQEHGLRVRSKVTPDLITLTASVPEPREQDIAPVRSNLAEFTKAVAATPRVPPGDDYRVWKCPRHGEVSVAFCRTVDCADYADPSPVPGEHPRDRGRTCMWCGARLEGFGHECGGCAASD